jgi:hypothetical protein
MADNLEAARNLREFVTRRTGSGVFTIQRLMQVAKDDNLYEVAGDVADLVEEGLLEQFVVVESPSGRGQLKEFPSILDVPERLHDWRTDLEFDVAPENIRVLYRVPASRT